MRPKKATAKRRHIRLPKGRKDQVHAQFGALCYRVRDGKLQVLLTTGRRSKAWIVPKGWPIRNSTGPESAMREAYEEAGVVGKITGGCIGAYVHLPSRFKIRLPRLVAVYPLKVRSLRTHFPETGQRKRKWFGAKKAAKKVANPELSALIAGFDPPHRPKRRG